MNSDTNNITTEDQEMLRQIVSEISEILSKHNCTDFILGTRWGEKAFITPITNDMKYVFQTANLIYTNIFNIPENELFEFLEMKGVIQKSETQPENNTDTNNALSESSISNPSLLQS